ncbi:MAG: cytochrome c oxidase subunit 3 family protein [bacterium]
MTGELSRQRKPSTDDHSGGYPGEEGLWIFILGDMLVFSLFFLTFLYYRALDIELFTASKAQLSVSLGAVNTLLLLTSSWFVVTGINAARRGFDRHARLLFQLALLCGLGFVGIKYIEYSSKVAQGYTLTSNDFFMYYYIFTGIHLIHVVIGMLVLWLMAKKVIGNRNGQSLRMLECGGIYWHMVDLLWIILFPLLYLV